MPQNTNIGWTDHTWNPVTGCTEVSPGCQNCYARVIAENKRGTPAFPNGFDVTLRPHKINDPIRWKTPAKIFVNSMSDLFHRDIPTSYLEQIWATMLKADQHIYQVLTKRPHRMAQVIKTLELPLPEHIWLGTTVEDQTFADNRIPALLSIPCPVRFLSCEPLLGPIDLSPYLYDIPAFISHKIKNDPGSLLALTKSPIGETFGQWADERKPLIKWVIDGGESGGGRRPADPEWFYQIRDQCLTAGVAYLHKQGNHFRSGQDRLLDGRTWDQYPDEVLHIESETTRPNQPQDLVTPATLL